MVGKYQKTNIVCVMLLIFLATVLPCAATTVTIRGTPLDTGSTDAGNISWDYSTFPALYYSANKNSQLVAGKGEHLYFADDGKNPSLGSSNPTANVIDEGELIYTTSQVASKYKVYSEETGVTKVTKFYTLSLFGTSYCAVDNDATNLAKVLMVQDGSDRKTLKSGDKWEMKNGYSLVMNAVDFDGSKCYITLYKDGEEIDTGVVSTGDSIDERIYTAEEEFGDGSDHIYFLTFVDSIFAGHEDNFAVLKYTWLIEKANPLTIGSGDEVGNFEVEEANETVLILSNSDPININVDAGATTSITGDWYFKSSDEGMGSNGGYVIYPIKIVTIEDPVTSLVTTVAKETIEEQPADEQPTESETEGVVVLDMSSDTKDNEEVYHSIAENADMGVETEAIQKASVPGFECFMGIISISMAFIFRRNN
jgi:S-layer protein (TIGR01567 family)